MNRMRRPDERVLHGAFVRRFLCSGYVCSLPLSRISTFFYVCRPSSVLHSPSDFNYDREPNLEERQKFSRDIYRVEDSQLAEALDMLEARCPEGVIRVRHTKQQDTERFLP